MALLVGRQRLKQITARIIHARTIFDRLLIGRAGGKFGIQIGRHDLIEILTVRKFSVSLEIPESFEKYDTSMKRSAWRISSIDSPRHFLASPPRPQLSSSR